MDESLYYNPQKLYSYNRLLNFVIGARGIGKSYAFKKIPIKNFIKKGEQFIYIRRYKSDLKKIQNYFNDVSSEFPDHKFEVKGRELWIDKKRFGWAIPLSSWQSEKSTAYPNVTTVVFDEFLIEKSNTRYLQNEVGNFLNLLDTIIRTRENVKVFCLSNATSIINPYFIYFQLIPDINKRFNAYDECVIEIPESRDFSEERKKTKFGRLISNTEYADMALNNEFTGDNETFIKKRPSYARFIFTICLKKKFYGVWIDDMTQELYISKKHNPNVKLILTCYPDDYKEGYTLIKSYKNHYASLRIVDLFKRGDLFFEDLESRAMGYEFLKAVKIF